MSFPPLAILPLITLMPLAFIIIPTGIPANFLLILSLAVGMATFHLPLPLFLKGVTCTLMLLYLTAALQSLSQRKDWALLFFLPPLGLVPLFFFPTYLPVGAVGLALLLILLLENLSRHHPNSRDRVFFLTLLIPPIFAVVYLYIPLALYKALSPKSLRVMAPLWICIMEAINLSALATALKGEALRIRVKPSVELTIKSLAFLLMATYVLVIVILNVVTRQGSFVQTTRFMVLSGIVLGVLGVSWQKGFLPRIRSYLLLHLYRERVDLYRFLSRLFTPSLNIRGYQEALRVFVEHLLEESPLAGASGALVHEGKENFRHQMGEITPYCLIQEQSLDPHWTAVLSVYLPHKPDELERMTVRILAALMAHHLAIIMAQEKRGVEEKLELARKLNRFIAHDLKNLAQTVKLYRQNLPVFIHQSPEEIQGDLEALFTLLDQRTHKAIDTLTSLTPPLAKARPFSLKRCLEKVTETLAFKDKITIQGKDLSLISDEDMLATVLENLLINAYQKDPSSIQITLRFWEEEDNVTIEVADNGAPVPPENRQRIFEPFFSTKPEGMGLGLYTVKKMINALQGEIGLYHNEKETVFKATIPKNLQESQRSYGLHNNSEPL